jgi:hypothetical protein
MVRVPVLSEQRMDIPAMSSIAARRVTIAPIQEIQIQEIQEIQIQIQIEEIEEIWIYRR